MKISTTSSAGSLLVLALLLPGCAGIRVDSWEQIDSPEFVAETWAWAPSPPEGAPATVSEVHRLIQNELAARGIVQVGKDDADVWVSHSLRVETQVRDAGCCCEDFFPREQYEVGTLRIDVVSPRSGLPIWSGSGESELRVSALGRDRFDQSFQPTRAEPNWKLDQKVPRILARLPFAETKQVSDTVTDRSES